ncbi:MAG: hypothetical protein JXA46_04835 [Dehalococcoidales bacterium]|nr:hypothetical protein [Dehalococcoidales bacterium]
MGKNAKYVVDKARENPLYPPFETMNDPQIVKPVITVDNEVIPGAQVFADTRWILPGAEGEIKLCDSHTHQFGEMLGFYGYNYDNIQDLGAEIEITIDNEKNILDRSFAAYVPPGVQHGPIIVRNVRHPIFWVSSGRAPKYE